MKKLGIVMLVTVALVAGFSGQATAAPIPVDLELALLVDVSGSVDATEFALQRDGYVSAFNSASVQAAIQAGALGKIAVTYIYWSGETSQQQTVGWTLIEDAASASAFAAAIAAAPRPFGDLTAPGSAINFTTPLFASNDFDGTRRVIDVSGDGAENDGADTSDARDAALAAGIDAVNGLPILGEFGLLDFYQQNIQGGLNSFTLPAASFAEFQAAIEAKLIRETGGGATVPEPASLALWSMLGLAGLGYRRYRLDKPAA